MMQSQVIVVAKTAMLNLLVLDSSVALAWMRRLSSQVKGLRQRLEIRDIRPAHSRVRAWLASHDGPEIALDRPLKDIARELGLTHEAFYRTLAALERDGLIQRRKGTITQIDKGI
jgi:CRP-like cAMP-binding protein